MFFYTPPRPERTPHPGPPLNRGGEGGEQKEGEAGKQDGAKKEAEGNGMIDNLLKTFGGKVVK